MGVNVLVFAVELQKVRTIFDRGLRRVSKLWKGKKALKNPFLQKLHQDIIVRTKFDKDGA